LPQVWWDWPGTRHYSPVRSVDEGQINVESEPGQGAIFTVQLPTQVVIETTESTQSDSAGKVPAASSETKTGLETILVIDDDPSVRDLMSRFLTKLNFHVVAAANGEEGIRLAKQVHPLLITSMWSCLTAMDGPF